MINDYFTRKELSCPCCSESKVNDKSLEKLIILRKICNFPFILSSSYRCEKYNNEKGYTQTHATGRAFDIVCSHSDAYKLLKNAPGSGFTGIGVSQKGGISTRFIHIDDLPNSTKHPRPHIWSY